MKDPLYCTIENPNSYTVSIEESSTDDYSMYVQPISVHWARLHVSWELIPTNRSNPGEHGCHPNGHCAVWSAGQQQSNALKSATWRPRTL